MSVFLNEVTIKINLVDKIPAWLLTKEWLANFDKIFWKDARKVTCLLHAIITEVYENSSCKIIAAQEPASNHISVGFQIKIASEQHDFANLFKIIEDVTALILVNNHHENKDLFSEVESICEEKKNKIMTQTKKFLGENGNKKISTPLEIQVNDKKFFVQGQFAKSDKKEVIFLSTSNVIGIVDLISNSEKYIVILDHKRRSLNVFYNPEIYFGSLVDLFKFGNISEFTIESIDKGKVLPENYLKQISPVVDFELGMNNS
jgi:hypothetical protein